MSEEPARTEPPEAAPPGSSRAPAVTRAAAAAAARPGAATAAMPLVVDPPRDGVLRAVLRPLRDAWRSGAAGPDAAELRDAQRDAILSRATVLAWLAVAGFPIAALVFALAAPTRITPALVVCGAGLAASLGVRFAIARGVFRVRYQLAMFVLVGLLLGPAAATLVELSGATGGTYLFAFFLIYFAFTALFPADAIWIVLASAAIVTSYVIAATAGAAYLGVAQPLANNLLYLGQLTFIGVVLNRVLCTLFFDERRARIDLRRARDALFVEMEVAQEIQTLLLPKEPQLPGFIVQGRMTPATEVGGDYYDLLESSSARHLVAIGDVSGHGVTTGLTMMMVRASLVAALGARPNASLEELYCAMNRALCRNLERMGLKLYMTFALLEHVGDGKLRAVGAHLPALVYRAAKQHVDEIELGGIWLGVIENLTPDMVPQAEFTLAKGDTLLLLTDGAVEATGADGAMFGWERLTAALTVGAPTSPAAVIDEIDRALAVHGGERDDDITLLALRYTGPLDATRAS
ncbi:MAG TPA: SpoIIE family protein phosphatase [Kofleriaceae bacterium]|jgi:hypothetical protein